MIRVGVLASGHGTDLQSIIDASKNKIIDARVVVVISDNNNAFALQRAKRNEIETFFLDPNQKNRDEMDQEISKILHKCKVDLVVGSGYMRILSKEFVEEWYGKLINIHPALLPSFKGTNGQRDALNYGVKITGCTTHFMDEEMDHGPIILQAAVLVHSHDNRDTLAQRILQVEHQLLPRTIQLFAQNRLTLEGRTVQISPGDSWKQKFETLPDVLYSEGY